MAQRFYYPAFYRHTKRLYDFLQRWQKDMVNINNITGTELTELNGLYNALDTVVRGSNWPSTIISASREVERCRLIFCTNLSKIEQKASCMSSICSTTALLTSSTST